MKTIKIFALVLLLASCSKDDEIIPCSTSPAGLTSNPSAKTKATVPFKASFYSSADTDPAIPPTPCSGDLPSLANAGYFLHGTSTLLGSIDAANSRGQDVTCDLRFATGLLTTSIAGQIQAANGDIIFYTGNDEIDVSNLLTGGGPSGSITGVWTITGGTGRFEGASGSFVINGFVEFEGPVLRFVADGTITF